MKGTINGIPPKDMIAMGGVEYAVPIGIALLLYFLFPAYLKNRQERLVERLRDDHERQFHRVGPVRIRGRWIDFPAVIAVSPDYIFIRNALSVYADEIPFERLRGLDIRILYRHDAAAATGDEPSGSILTITTVDHTYILKFDSSESSAEWKIAIEEAL
jgi:hypothetical protein